MTNRRNTPHPADEELFLPLAANAAIHLPKKPVLHRNADFEEENVQQLLQMQQEHFWYLGRHRFILHALRRLAGQRKDLHAIDLGGGCGGWLAYLHERLPDGFSELALADSSLEALHLAGPVVGEFATRYHVNLYDLGWKNRWDVVFLLDVLEHLSDDSRVLQQIYEAMRPGGLLFVTTPALPIFHSYNDDLVHHLRRYTRADFARLALQSSLRLLRSRYFMFLLSPLVMARRWRAPRIGNMSQDEIRILLDRTHAVPSAIPNKILSTIFAAETPLGWHVPFPWGTSILGVFEKAIQPENHR
jgi:2-polyprenyl-3-methyl-5-hydroxy-6-metoxy-1,4-benzoquinol methylase